MKIAVVVASVGRPTELARWVDHVRRQTLEPAALIFSVAEAADLPPDFQSEHARIIMGPRGSAHQRNAGLAACSADTDIVAFFDDDYVPSRHCLKGIENVFASDPTLGGVSGRLLADGASGPGIGWPDARELVDAFDQQYIHTEPTTAPAPDLYGCNMAFRAATIRDLRFDETLPGYGLYEDSDFSRRVAKRARIAMSDAFTGVHQGLKNGRVAGTRFGYSQIANPWWLRKKGVLTTAQAARLMVRSIMANHLRSVRPLPWVDHAGRAAGGRLAVVDLMRGRLHPARTLNL